VRLERAASRVCMRAFQRTQLPGKLFLNFSADAIREIDCAKEDVWRFLESIKLRPDRIVFELTEQAPTGDLATLSSSLHVVRDVGVQLALDDYGTGNAALNLWSELEPDYIKVDRSIVDKVKQSAFRFEVLRTLQRLGSISHAALIAEGLESAEDLMICRDLGIAYGQGFLLGRPEAEPAERLDAAALTAIRATCIAVFPEVTTLAPRGFSAGKLVISAPTVSQTACNNDILDFLTRRQDLHAIAIVENDIPIGLINRRSFANAYALP
jgi:EAL domain-containing protein (putative c-di-GMP-specific phosphodiesterase class I)